MNRLIEWRSAPWALRLRGGHATRSPGGEAVLSRERERELDQPTYLRRRLAIAGLPASAPAARAVRPGGGSVPAWPAVANSRA